MKPYHLVIIGVDEIVTNKYYPIIETALRTKIIDSYSIIDLETSKADVTNRINGLSVKPKNSYFLKNQQKSKEPSNPDEFVPVLDEILNEEGIIRVYIATELKAHEGYLRYCIENGIDCLVEKPVLAPFKNGMFDPSAITPIITELHKKLFRKPANHTVMTLGRYHKIYNELLIDGVKKRVEKYEAPVTSFHFRHAGGVWNTHTEYNSREDHPYKYGYGMIMHGGYHYIDLSMQMLYLNKILYPQDRFDLRISSFAAFPKDQNDRISKKYAAKFNDNEPMWSNENNHIYGETDITTTFALDNITTGRRITVGTLSFEQTTPSIRTWEKIPEELYNKNGRTSSCEVEAQLSTLFSSNAFVYDIPVSSDGNIDRIDAFARLTNRSNASLLPDEKYIEVTEYGGLFHSDSNRDLMYQWMINDEKRSRFETHIPSMRLVQALCESAIKQGETITVENF